GRLWWVQYKGHDGLRHKESSDSERKGDAIALLQKRTGAVMHNLPVIKYQERLTFDQAAQAVIDDFKVNHKVSEKSVARRIDKHLKPFFGGRRLAAIKAADVDAYIAHRVKQGIIAVKGPNKDKRVADVSNAEVNRELQLLKRIFSLAMAQDRIAMRPKVKM